MTSILAPDEFTIKNGDPRCVWAALAERLEPKDVDEEEERRRDYARTHMIGYIQYTFPGYITDPFHEDVCNAIDRVVFTDHPDGHISHLMLFAPPQHGKSEIVSTRLPGYWLANNPHLPVALTSYNQRLAFRNSRLAKACVESPAYDRLFGGPEYGIVRDIDNWRVKDWHILGHKGFVFSAGIEGDLTGEGFGLGVIDDPIKDWAAAQSEVIRENAWDWWRGTYTTRMWENHRTVFMMCMVGKTKVLMADGTWRYLDIITPGEKVKSWKDGNLVESKVTHFVPQGKAQVFEIKTGNHKITATANHPIYVLRDKAPEWVRVDKLKIGDRLIVLGQQKGGDNPRELTIEDCWALGFMFGDGWLTYHPSKNTGTMRWKTSVAAGMDEALNQKIVGYLNRKFDIDIRYNSKARYYTTESARLGRWFESLGLIGTAKTKRIPDLVFNLPLEYRLAFIKGIIDSDGHVNKHRRASFCFTSQLFTVDLKLLACSCGFRVTNINRQHGIYKPPGSPKPIYADFYRIEFSIVNTDKTDFALSKVRSIRMVGVHTVYDLTVADTHNFIAEGVVVKNTRWHEDDLAARIIDSEGTVEEGGKWFILAYPALAESQDERDKLAEETGRPVGLPDPLGRFVLEPLAPSRFSVEYLLDVRDNVGSLVWGAEYQQHPTPPKGDFFRVGRIQIEPMYPIESFGGQLVDQVPVGLKKCVRFWDLAASEKKKGTDPDYTSGTLVGIDREGFTWILHQVSLRGTSDQVEEIIMQTANLDGKKVKIRMEQEPGASGKSLCNTYLRKLAGYDFEGIPASGDPEVRAYTFSAQVNASNVRLVEAPWNKIWLARHRTFPFGKHDDEITSTSGAFNVITGGKRWFRQKFKHL